jgi:hypothetical protein
MICDSFNLFVKTVILILLNAIQLSSGEVIFGNLSSQEWSCKAGDLVLSVSSNISTYSVYIGNDLWLEKGDVALHFHGVPGIWLTSSSGTLLPTTITPSSGEDKDLGNWSSLTVSWSGAPFPFITTFQCWIDSDTIEWKTFYPNDTPFGLSTGDLVTDSSFYNFNLTHSASSHFPSFLLGPDSVSSALGHIEFAGEFSFHNNNFGISFEGFVGGQLGGPTVLHSPSWQRSGNISNSKPRAGVIGSLSGFKDSCMFIVPDVNDPTSNSWRLVYGPHSYFDSLPSGFSSRLGFVSPRSRIDLISKTAIYPGDTGITSAVYSFGSFLRIASQTMRFPPEDDIGVSVLSAWTDNGAAYDGDFWNSPMNQGKGGTIFSELKNGFKTNAHLSVGSLQLDPYWFSTGEPGIKDWFPSQSVFGVEGFNKTIQEFNTTLYSWMFAPNNHFVQQGFNFANSPPWNTFITGPMARISPQDSERFYTLLLDRCIDWKCIGFEIDFLDMQYAGFPDVLTTPGSFELFLKGLSTAGVNHGVPIQLCMPLCSDVLASVLLPGVSNIRASDDDDLDYAGADRWRIGLTSLLFGSLDIRPFMDAVWTVSTNPSYKYFQNATELGIAISALSTGPVGIGDGINSTNTTLVNAAIALNGVILKPSLPATPLDIYFLYNSNGSSILQAAKSELWAAPSFIPYSNLPSQPGRGGLSRFGSLPPSLRKPKKNTFPNRTLCPWFTILSVDVPSFTLFPTDMTPSLSHCNGTYVSMRWSLGFSEMAIRCANNASALQCLETFYEMSGLDVSTGTAQTPSVRGGPHSFEIFSLSPILFGSNGWTLLGEVGKVVRVSPIRFSAVLIGESNGSFTTWIEGAPNENVYVTWLAPSTSGILADSRIVSLEIQFNSKGETVKVVCQGISNSAECIIAL